MRNLLPLALSTLILAGCATGPKAEVPDVRSFKASLLFYDAQLERVINDRTENSREVRDKISKKFDELHLIYEPRVHMFYRPEVFSPLSLQEDSILADIIIDSHEFYDQMQK